MRIAGLAIGLAGLALGSCADSMGNGGIVGMTIGGVYIGSHPQAAAYSAPTASGPKITGNTSPACQGMSIIDAGEGQYSGIVPGMYVKVQNTSGERKWLQADIKYTQETHTALQNTAEEY